MRIAVALYVGVGVYGTPQECIGTAMLFGEATFLNICFGVA
jgi:hypothetical protein